MKVSIRPEACDLPEPAEGKSFSIIPELNALGKKFGQVTYTT